MIIHATLLTLVFVVIKMLYTYPNHIDLEHYVLKNCIGMITYITILRKIPSLILLPNGIIKSINNFINGTDTIAGTLMDGNPPTPPVSNICPCDNQTTMCANIKSSNDIMLVDNQSQPTNIVEKTIIKSILEKIINGL